MGTGCRVLRGYDIVALCFDGKEVRGCPDGEARRLTHNPQGMLATIAFLSVQGTTGGGTRTRDLLIHREYIPPGNPTLYARNRGFSPRKRSLYKVFLWFGCGVQVVCTPRASQTDARLTPAQPVHEAGRRYGWRELLDGDAWHGVPH